MELSTMEHRVIHELAEACSRSEQSMYSTWTPVQVALTRRAARIPKEGSAHYVNLGVTILREGIAPSRNTELAGLLTAGVMETLRATASMSAEEKLECVQRVDDTWRSCTPPYEGTQKDAGSQQSIAKWIYAHCCFCEAVLDYLCQSNSIPRSEVINEWVEKVFQGMWRVFRETPPVAKPITLQNHLVLSRKHIIGRMLHWCACWSSANKQQVAETLKAAQQFALPGELALIVARLVFEILVRAKELSSFSTEYRKNLFDNCCVNYTLSDETALEAAKTSIETVASINPEVTAFGEFVFAKAFVVLLSTTPARQRCGEAYCAMEQLLETKYDISNSPLQSLQWKVLSLSIE